MPSRRANRSRNSGRGRSKPLNVNFFCHTPPQLNNAREARWRDALKPYYEELEIDPSAPIPTGMRMPFDAAFCDLVEELKPEVISFHFGLPPTDLFKRVKALGSVTMSSATTVAEARWLEAQGVDAIIAQGFEAGGHRGMFLSDNLAAQVGTFALVPQIVDAVKLPVIAAGAVSDARGIAAAFMLGAAGVQVGSAFLHCPESKVTAPHRAALAAAQDDGTRVTNMMTGRPARGFINRVMRDIGPISDLAPEFPLASGAIMPLRAKAEAKGSGDFTSHVGGAGGLARARAAGGRGDAQACRRRAGTVGAKLTETTGRRSCPSSGGNRTILRRRGRWAIGRRRIGLSDPCESRSCRRS